MVLFCFVLQSPLHKGQVATIVLPCVMQKHRNFPCNCQLKLVVGGKSSQPWVRATAEGCKGKSFLSGGRESPRLENSSLCLNKKKTWSVASRINMFISFHVLLFLSYVNFYYEDKFKIPSNYIFINYELAISCI